MCGRFVSSSSPEKIAEYFGAAFEGETLGENYNVAPTNDIYAVVAGPDGQPRLEVFHWGLIPVWAKDAKVGQKMINARSETASAFRSLFVNRWLWGAIALSVLLQVAVVHLQPLNFAFGTAPLSLQQWAVCVAMGSSVLWVGELRKAVIRGPWSKSNATDPGRR